MADIIDDLLALDDGALSEKLGLQDRVKTFREDLEKANTLSGDAREKVVRHVNEIFTPKQYAVEDLSWQVKHAAQKAKTGSSPSEIVGCGCGMPGDYD